MLNTRYDNVPMVIGWNGDVNDDINFTFDSNTVVAHSCSASLNDEMWVFGGYNNYRQVNL